MQNAPVHVTGTLCLSFPKAAAQAANPNPPTPTRRCSSQAGPPPSLPAASPLNPLAFWTFWPCGTSSPSGEDGLLLQSAAERRRTRTRLQRLTGSWSKEARADPGGLIWWRCLLSFPPLLFLLFSAVTASPRALFQPPVLPSVSQLEKLADGDASAGGCGAAARLFCSWTSASSWCRCFICPQKRLLLCSLPTSAPQLAGALLTDTN